MKPFTISEEELVKCIAFVHGERDFRYWDNTLEICTTFKTMHAVWAMQKVKLLEVNFFGGLR